MPTLNRDELAIYLQQWSILAPPEKVPPEWMSVVNERIRIFAGEHALRYSLTAGLLPVADKGARLLEIGSAPYLSSLMLEHKLGYNVSHINLSHDERLPPPIELRNETTGESSNINPDEFNVEFDRFPYDDASFNAAACCEIIEHLTMDPAHMIAEINRVLKVGGTLALTTPNILNVTNVTRMMRGFNIYEPYSVHPVFGAYGRHNREYSPDELCRLLEELGFRIKSCTTQDIYTPQRTLESRLEELWIKIPIAVRSLVSRRRDASLAMKRDLIFISAEKIADVEEHRPDWLYYPVDD